MPVYQRLASTEILNRCTSPKTQNQNESLQTVIWNKCPKEVFVSKSRLELAVTSAASEFNFDCVTSLRLMNDCDDNENMSSLSIAIRKDHRREKQKCKRESEDFKNNRKSKIFTKLASDAQCLKSEGLTYVPGAF
ncbi:hypothetical protein AVEN_152981-1 [Araneus ventricosus]|uniref:Uncharacterized protein n=1 Tax=Araneus ventricosus TaxID=182803 RepID=A0A4Y2AD67_ARAVE|nr:hypothetical protein AVEN_152981-1 [Araneus ventricosus]